MLFPIFPVENRQIPGITQCVLMCVQNPMLRNVFREEEESDEWQAIVAEFPNKIPRFQSKSECEAWMRKYVEERASFPSSSMPLILSFPLTLPFPFFALRFHSR